MMEEKKATLRLHLDAHGRLKRSDLILDDQSETVNALIEKKERLLYPMGAKTPIKRKGHIYVHLNLGSIRKAAGWKLDAEEEISGLSVQLVDQKGRTVPIPRGIFANPQYF